MQGSRRQVRFGNEARFGLIRSLGPFRSVPVNVLPNCWEKLDWPMKSREKNKQMFPQNL